MVSHALGSRSGQSDRRVFVYERNDFLLVEERIKHQAIFRSVSLRSAHNTARPIPPVTHAIINRSRMTYAGPGRCEKGGRTSTFLSRKRGNKPELADTSGASKGAVSSRHYFQRSCWQSPYFGCTWTRLAPRRNDNPISVELQSSYGPNLWGTCVFLFNEISYKWDC